MFSRFVHLKKSVFNFFSIKNISLFTFGPAGSLLLCMCFLWLQWVGATLYCNVRVSYCCGFCCFGAWALKCVSFNSWGSPTLEYVLSYCGVWTPWQLRTGKSQFSFQSQRRAMPKNVKATIQLCSFHIKQGYLQNTFKKILTECGPLEKGMANHFSILALRTPWTVWKGKMIRYWKRSSPGQ